MRHLSLAKAFLRRVTLGPISRLRRSARGRIRPSLRDLAAGKDWSSDPATGRFLSSLSRAMGSRSYRRIAVRGDSDEVAPLVELLGRAQPQAEITLVGSGLTEQLAHVPLTAHGPFDLLLDVSHGSPADQITFFRRYLFHVRPGGLYAVRHYKGPDSAGAKSLWRFVAGLVEIDLTSEAGPAPSWPARDDRAIAAALRRMTVDRDLLVLTHAAVARPKIREVRADEVVQARSGLGEILEAHPGGIFESRCTLTVNDHAYDARFRSTYDNPGYSLRAYEEVACLPHQVALAGGVILPDTYRHYYAPRLQNRFTTEVGQYFATPDQKAEPDQHLEGPYFYLDSEWPNHFGHTLTEQLSRMWAWPAAKSRIPGLKALLLVPKGRRDVDGFQRTIFQAAGVAPADLVAVSGSVRVDTLVAATPMMANPDFMNPSIESVWRRTGARLIAEAPRTRSYPARVFCSRRPTYKRSCHNAGSVEEIFRGHGFEIIHPEEYPMAEQVALLWNAEAVAGFAGSAMFTLALCPGPKDVLLLSSESYTARNEYMIASVLGHDLTIAWCDADEKQPDRGWAGSAFASSFTFNHERDGDFVRRWLERH